MPNASQIDDIVNVTQLVLRERECRDMSWWNAMRDCFWPDSRVHISWIKGTGEDFVRGSIDMAARGFSAKHQMTPPVVRLKGDRAVASMVGVIAGPSQIDGVAVTLSSFARFLVGAERRDTVWRIASFEAIYMRDTLTADIPGEHFAISPQALANYRPSYRMLCHVLAQTGYVPDQDLPGEDRPDTVKAKLDQVYGWAGIDPDSPA